jgi:3-oxoacyl-[acyl-carrier protein] reductase
MDLGLVGKVALVTGGARGIGAEIARGLLKEGAEVIVTSRNQETLDDFSAGLPVEQKAKSRGIVHSLRLAQIDSLTDALGESAGLLDIVVNNAGDTLNITDPFCSEEDWQRVLELNALFPIALNKRVLGGMIAREWGRVVNITSVAGQENSGPVPFSTAKAAISAYSRSMGRVLAGSSRNVVMTAVFPGVVATAGGHWGTILNSDPERAEKYLRERVPAGRFGTEKEVADTVVFYCSELVSFSHGAIVPVDGGHAKHYMYHNFMD